MDSDPKQPLLNSNKDYTVVYVTHIQPAQSQLQSQLQPQPQYQLQPHQIQAVNRLADSISCYNNIKCTAITMSIIFIIVGIILLMKR
jgi:hypothetical protein